MILNDAYGGHRKWWDSEWVEDPSLVNVWTDWDYIFLRVYQYMQDYTTKNGQPVWVEEDPDVQWEINKRVSYLDKELAEYEDSHELKKWETPVAKAHWEDVEEVPSMRKWLKRMEDEEQGRTPNGPDVRGRPPTLDELDAMRANTENR